ncbi:MAG: GNAT family N-acetyltransferase [Anaerolineae bacterium]
MEIIKAQPEHAKILATLLEPVQKIHADHYPDLFKFPLDREAAEKFFSNRIGQRHSTFFIAMVDGEPAGYIWCTRENRTESLFKHAHSMIYIQQLSVNPESQGLGVGRALMLAAEKLAEDSGVTKIELDSWGFNGQAHSFFEKMGYARFNVSMWKTLEL